MAFNKLSTVIGSKSFLGIIVQRISFELVLRFKVVGNVFRLNSFFSSLVSSTKKPVSSIFSPFESILEIKKEQLLCNMKEKRTYILEKLFINHL